MVYHRDGIMLTLSLVIITLLAHLHATNGVTTAINYASWVLTSPSGVPPKPMCDHTTTTIDGRLMVMYGGDDSDFFFANRHNISVLDVRNENAPSWSTLTLTSSVRPAYRSAATSSINPSNGHVIMFGGYTINYPVYLDDLWLLAIDVASLSNSNPSQWHGAWHAMRPPSDDGASNGGPSARGWTDMQWADPATMTTLILYGGLGTSTGNLGTILDADQYDTWLLNATLLDDVINGIYTSMPPLTPNTRAAEWNVVENSTCLEYTTKCTDSKTASDRFPLLTEYTTNLTNLLSTTTRASDMVALLQQIKDIAASMSSSASADATSWPTNPGNTLGNCSTLCSTKATLSSQPRASEGHRSVVVSTIYFQFGGYACTTYGDFVNGGPSCYDSSMYFLDLGSQQWYTLAKPGDGSDQDLMWPSARAYHSMVHNNGRLWIFGGGYKDQTSVFSYYNDVHVFNIATLAWEAVTITGTIPEARWSHTSTIIGNSMWMIAGCSSAVQYFNNVYQLRIGAKILAANCSATGDGLYTGLAGTPASFTIQTRSPGYYNHNGTYIWGDTITWGTDLTFDVRLVSTSTTAGAQCLFTFTEVTEIGNGLYNVSFIPESGETQLLNVFLNNDHIPGSPFSFTLLPSVATSTYSVASGVGIKSTVKGETAQVLVTLYDEYGNTQNSGGNAAGIVAYASAVTVSTSVYDYNNGSYLVTYTVPLADSFLIDVQYDGASIAGSPYTVRGYAQLAVQNGLMYTMVSLTTIAILLCLMAILFIICQRRNKVIRASSPLFMVCILVGACLGLSSVYALVDVNDASCQAFQWLLGLGFTIMLSCVYAKTWRISTIFTSTLLKKRRDIKDIHLLARCAILIGFEVFWNSIWSGISPLHPHKSFSSSNPVLSVTSCTCDNSNVWYGVSVGTKALLVLAGVFLATMTKDVPAAFNESKLLAIAIYNAAFCSLVGLPIMFFVTNSAADNTTSLFTLKAMLVLWEIFATVAILMYPRIYYVIKPPPAGFFDTHQRPASGMLHGASGMLHTQGGYTPNGGPVGSPHWPKSATHNSNPGAGNSMLALGGPAARGSALVLPQGNSRDGTPAPVVANRATVSPGPDHRNMQSPHTAALHRLAKNDGTLSSSGRNAPLFADVRPQLMSNTSSPAHHPHHIGANGKDSDTVGNGNAPMGGPSQAWTATSNTTTNSNTTGPLPSPSTNTKSTASIAPAPSNGHAINGRPSSSTMNRRAANGSNDQHQQLLSTKDSSSTPAATPGSRVIASSPLSFMPTSVMGSPSSVHHAITAEPSASSSARGATAQQLAHLENEIEKRRGDMDGDDTNTNEPGGGDAPLLPMRARVDSMVMAGPMFSGHRTSMVSIPDSAALIVATDASSPAARTHTIRSTPEDDVAVTSVRAITYALDGRPTPATVATVSSLPLSVVSEGGDQSSASDNASLHFPTSSTPNAAALVRSIDAHNSSGSGPTMTIPATMANRAPFLHSVATPANDSSVTALR